MPKMRHKLLLNTLQFACILASGPYWSVIEDLASRLRPRVVEVTRLPSYMLYMAPASNCLG